MNVGEIIYMKTFFSIARECSRHCPCLCVPKRNAGTGGSRGDLPVPAGVDLISWKLTKLFFYGRLIHMDKEHY